MYCFLWFEIVSLYDSKLLFAGGINFYACSTVACPLSLTRNHLPSSHSDVTFASEKIHAHNRHSGSTLSTRTCHCIAAIQGYCSGQIDKYPTCNDAQLIPRKTAGRSRDPRRAPRACCSAVLFC